MTIHDRVIADLGTNPPLPGIPRDHVEPALGMTRRVRVAVNHQLGLAIPRGMTGTNQAISWNPSDIIGTGRAFDNSIAVVDPALDKFVVFGSTSAFAGNLRYSVYTPTSGFSPWTVAYMAAGQPGGNDSCDKPWVIRRTASDFLVFVWRGPTYGYLRSPSGDNWLNPDNTLLPIRVVSTVPTEPPVIAGFCCQPAVTASGDVMLAHAYGNIGSTPAGSGAPYKVLIGNVNPNDPSGDLQFRYLKDSGGAPLEWHPRLNQQDSLPIPVRPGNVYISRMVPNLVCDPSDDSYAYVCYQDSDPDFPEDVNVYVAVLHRSGLTWMPPDIHRFDIEAIRLSDGARADQFTPTAIVDSAGRIHVVYYDNRPSEGNPGWGTLYDKYYAISVDHGNSFTTHRLRTDDEASPAMDLEIKEPDESPGLSLDWSAREYNGIAIYETGGTVRVWTTYTGTAMNASDGIGARGVTYGQQIVVSFP